MLAAQKPGVARLGAIVLVGVDARPAIGLIRRAGFELGSADQADIVIGIDPHPGAGQGGVLVARAQRQRPEIRRIVIVLVLDREGRERIQARQIFQPGQLVLVVDPQLQAFRLIEFRPIQAHRTDEGARREGEARIAQAHSDIEGRGVNVEAALLRQRVGVQIDSAENFVLILETGIMREIVAEDRQNPQHALLAVFRIGDRRADAGRFQLARGRGGVSIGIVIGSQTDQNGMLRALPPAFDFRQIVADLLTHFRRQVLDSRHRLELAFSLVDAVQPEQGERVVVTHFQRVRRDQKNTFQGRSSPADVATPQLNARITDVQGDVVRIGQNVGIGDRRAVRIR